MRSRGTWPATGRPTTGRPTTGRPTTGRPTTGRPTTGRPTASRSATRGAQRGSVAPFAVVAVGLLLLVGVALGVVAAMIAAHRTAQAAADLAALAGADAAVNGGDPCAVAGQIAAANRATLADCAVTGSDVLVTVTVAGPHWLGANADLQAQARAGPDP